jgi:hypothetical protein
MSFQDKSIQCSDCGTTFTFSAEKQEVFQSKGYANEPKRCPSCRQARRADRYGRDTYTLTALCRNLLSLALHCSSTPSHARQGSKG